MTHFTGKDKVTTPRCVVEVTVCMNKYAANSHGKRSAESTWSSVIIHHLTVQQIFIESILYAKNEYKC